MEENNSDNESEATEASSILPPLESISPSPSSDNEDENTDANVVHATNDEVDSDEGEHASNEKQNSSDKLDSNKEDEREKENNNKSKKENGPPTEFICPVTLDIMDDPVVASDGFSYERTAIAEQIRRAGYGQAARSPMTQQPLSTTLVTNQVLKNQIVEWKDRHGIVTTSTPTPPPVVSSVPPSVSSTNRNQIAAELIRRSEVDHVAAFTAHLLQQQHITRTGELSATLLAAESSTSSNPIPTGRRPPRIRRRRVDEIANGSGTTPLGISSTSTTTTATRTTNSGRSRTMMGDDDEPPPLISLEQTTTNNNPSTNNNTITIPMDTLPQSLMRMYLTGILLLVMRRYHRNILYIVYHGIYERCTWANVHQICRDFNLWTMIKEICSHILIFLTFLGWFGYRGVMFFVQRATILQRLMTALGLVSTLIALHSQKSMYVVSVGLVWIYGLIEVMCYEEYIRWKYNGHPTVISQNVLYRNMIPGKTWHDIMLLHVGPMLYGTGMVRQMIRWCQQARDECNRQEEEARQAREALQPNGSQRSDNIDVVQARTAYVLVAPIVLVCTFLLLFSLWWFGWYTVLGVMGIMWLPHIKFVLAMSLFPSPVSHIRSLFEVSDTQACGSRLLLKAAVRNIWLQFLFCYTLFGTQPNVFIPVNTCVAAKEALSSKGGAYFSGTKTGHCQRIDSYPWHQPWVGTPWGGWYYLAWQGIYGQICGYGNIVMHLALAIYLCSELRDALVSENCQYPVAGVTRYTYRLMKRSFGGLFFPAVSVFFSLRHFVANVCWGFDGGCVTALMVPIVGQVGLSRLRSPIAIYRYRQAPDLTFSIWVNLQTFISYLPMMFLSIALLPIPNSYFSLVQRCHILHQITLLPQSAGPKVGSSKLMEELPTWFCCLFYFFTTNQMSWSDCFEDLIYVATRQMIVEYIPKYVLGTPYTGMSVEPVCPTHNPVLPSDQIFVIENEPNFGFIGEVKIVKVTNQPSIAVGGENFVFVHGTPHLGQPPIQLIPFSNIMGKARDVAELCFTD